MFLKLYPISNHIYNFSNYLILIYLQKAHFKINDFSIQAYVANIDGLLPVALIEIMNGRLQKNETAKKYLIDQVRGLEKTNRSLWEFIIEGNLMDAYLYKQKSKKDMI